MLLDADNTQLACIDIQGRLADAVTDTEIVLANAKRLIYAARYLEVPLVLMEQVPDKLGPTREELKEALEGVPAFAKTSFSACGSEEFNFATGITHQKQVVIIGIEAHVCVLQTAIDLQKRGFTPYVVADAISSRRETDKQIALQRLAHYDIEVVTTEMVIFEWLKDARHPQFRAVQSLMK
ncbi:MAG: isochorismatase family protein [Spartobacteria bacterium]|nr:isochorismatase family protein [Spartobacteria bacterium]